MPKMKDAMDRDLEPLLEQYAEISDRCWYAETMGVWVVGDLMPNEPVDDRALEAFTFQAVQEDIRDQEGWVFSLHSPSTDRYPYMAKISRGTATNKRPVRRLGPTPAYALLWAYLGLVDKLKKLGVWK